VFAAVQPERLSGWVPGLRLDRAISFVVATEFVYWSGWHDLRLALPLTLVGVPLFLVMRRGEPGSTLLAELRWGAWIIDPLPAGGLILLSWLGTFKGSGTCRPYDSILVAGWPS